MESSFGGKRGTMSSYRNLEDEEDALLAQPLLQVKQPANLETFARNIVKQAWCYLQKKTWKA
jgi:hypothetical protein